MSGNRSFFGTCGGIGKSHLHSVYRLKEFCQADFVKLGTGTANPVIKSPYPAGCLFEKGEICIIMRQDIDF